MELLYIFGSLVFLTFLLWLKSQDKEIKNICVKFAFVLFAIYTLYLFGLLYCDVLNYKIFGCGK